MVGKRAAVTAVAAMCLAAPAGCGGYPAGPGGMPAATAVTAADCDRVARVPLPGPGVPTAVLVVDATGSAKRTSLPPAAAAALGRAQAGGEQLVILAVNGGGAAPTVVADVALDPAPKDRSVRADAARRIAITCVSRWATSASTRPTVPGSDILGALDAAGDRDPRQIVVVSDGLSNVAPLDLNAIGYDADATSVAAALAAGRSLAPGLAGAEVLWTDLGDTVTPLPESVKASLTDLWSAILHAAGAVPAFDTKPGTPVPRGNATAPTDLVTVPTVANVHTGCATTVTVPAALLFTAGSAVLAPGAASVVKGLADQLAAHPDWRATVEGHTADYGTAAYQQDLSRQRAQAVVDGLVADGVAASRLSSAGYGATKPAAAEFHGGVHDLAAAARNRRVVVVMAAAGCVP